MRSGLKIYIRELSGTWNCRRMDENSEGESSEWGGERLDLCPEDCQHTEEEELQTEGGRRHSKNYVAEEQKGGLAMSDTAERTCGGNLKHCIGQALWDLPKNTVLMECWKLNVESMKRESGTVAGISDRSSEGRL